MHEKILLDYIRAFVAISLLAAEGDLSSLNAAGMVSPLSAKGGLSAKRSLLKALQSSPHKARHL